MAKTPTPAQCKAMGFKNYSDCLESYTDKEGNIGFRPKPEAKVCAAKMIATLKKKAGESKVKLVFD